MAPNTSSRVIGVGHGGPTILVDGPRDLTGKVSPTIPPPAHLARLAGTSRFQEHFSQEMETISLPPSLVQEHSGRLSLSPSSSREHGCMTPVASTVTRFFKRVFKHTPAQTEVEMWELPTTIVTVQPGREPAMGINLDASLSPIPAPSPQSDRPAADANVLGHHPGGLADDYYGFDSNVTESNVTDQGWEMLTATYPHKIYTLKYPKAHLSFTTTHCVPVIIKEDGFRILVDCPDLDNSGPADHSEADDAMWSNLTVTYPQGRVIIKHAFAPLSVALAPCSSPVDGKPETIIQESSVFVIGDDEDERDESDNLSIVGSPTFSTVGFGDNSELDTDDSSVPLAVHYTSPRASLLSILSNEAEADNQSPATGPAVRYVIPTVRPVSHRAALISNSSSEDDEADNDNQWPANIPEVRHVPRHSSLFSVLSDEVDADSFPPGYISEIQHAVPSHFSELSDDEDDVPGDSPIRYASGRGSITITNLAPPEVRNTSRRFTLLSDSDEDEDDHKSTANAPAVRYFIPTVPPVSRRASPFPNSSDKDDTPAGNHNGSSLWCRWSQITIDGEQRVIWPTPLASSSSGSQAAEEDVDPLAPRHGPGISTPSYESLIDYRFE